VTISRPRSRALRRVGPPREAHIEEASEHFGWVAAFIGVDSPATSALTRELVGWQPTHPGLIKDLDQGHYFRNPSA